jgi:hypothetical protein
VAAALGIHHIVEVEGALARQIVCDDRFFPLVLFRWGRRPAAADYFAMFSDYERLYRRGRRFFAVHDTAECAALPGAEERRALVEMCREQAEEAARYCVGTAIVAPNRAVHDGLSAVGWLVPHGSLWIVVDDLPSAVDRAIEALRAEGLPPSSGLSTYQAQLHARPA